jgi:hypothetical protein
MPRISIFRLRGVVTHPIMTRACYSIRFNTLMQEMDVSSRVMIYAR